ncbi:hypothetical protein Poli38472_000828 [Pythium oligandrum]|uniref:Uncharacterized protein n=1 Tax=Pythium oligandrum TaxID=41045 RepID=A0A8K1CCF2_PYTOL|nr:hypothetical protein Poli38472_000828 [Pythium oligandrum]|eukprot:TMW60786.1 hypothetical protein Poli38472_000828 [Pythium oligandrum]
MKKNGEMHRLCEEHRAKANSNQKRVDERKRTLKQPDREEQKATSRENNAGTVTPSEDHIDDESASFNLSLLDPDDLDDMEIEDLEDLVLAAQFDEMKQG